MQKESWKKNKQLLIGIISVAILLRVAAAITFGDQVVNLPGTYDQISYHNLALRVLEGHGFSFGEPWWPATPANAPTAHWSFLYTLYLVVVYAIFGPHAVVARVIQAIIVGILQPLLAFYIGRFLFGSAVGLISAALTAIYVYFFYYAATLMTEPFYITAILASLYLAMILAGNKSQDGTNPSKGKEYFLAFALGITLAIAVLLRQLFVIFVPMLFVWIWWSRRSLKERSAIPSLMISTLIIAISIVPFTIYNYQRFGRFLLNTNAGFAFFWGNHPVYGTHFLPILPSRLGTYQSLIPKELLSLDEAALDQALLRRGLQFVFDDPRRYILLSISRIPVYFMFWPSQDSSLLSNVSRVGSFGVFLPFMIYGIWRALSPVRIGIKMISSPIFLLISFIVVYTTIHLLSWALIRYRLPVDAILVVFASLAIVDILQRLKISIPVLRFQTRNQV